MDAPAIPIPDAAAKYEVSEKRLRGAVWRENVTGDLAAPIGSFKQDLVQDDETLKRWVRRQAPAKSEGL
jgi:hypothetical protein